MNKQPGWREIFFGKFYFLPAIVALAINIYLLDGIRNFALVYLGRLIPKEIGEFLLHIIITSLVYFAIVKATYKFRS